jgi:hypothetical protein
MLTGIVSWSLRHRGVVVALASIVLVYGVSAPAAYSPLPAT